MKTVSCHRKYPITTNFLDTMLEHSVIIEEGETKLDAYRRGLKELDQIAAELRKEATENINMPFSQAAGYVPPPCVTTTSGTGPMVIDMKALREIDAIEDQIISAETIEELKAIKSKYDLMPASCLTQYDKKMEQLKAGRPGDFTEGLE